MAKRYEVGDVIFNEKYGNYTILEWVDNSRKVKVEFESTGSVYDFSSAVIYKNEVKDYMAKTNRGVACLGIQNKHDFSEVRKQAYSTWQRMLTRCYSVDVRTERPNYSDCTVSDDWLCFENFFSWFQEQVDSGFYEKGYQLDKDLLVQGNKVYSKDTCVFLPFRLNSLLQVKKRSKGNYLPGVNFDKSRGLFKWEVNFNGERYYGRRTPSEVDAFLEYKQLKEKLVRDDAKNWVGKLPSSAIEALTNYTLDWVLLTGKYLAEVAKED